MEIALLEVKKAGDNKDFNGGFGTTFQVGKTLKSRILSLARSNLENIPTFSYAYISSILKAENHKVDYYLNEIPKKKYDFILIHVSLIRHNEEIKAIEELRQKGQIIGVYGPLATIRPELFEKATFTIKGEPEEVIIKIARHNVIPSGVIESRPLENLDILPFPDWGIYKERPSLSPVINIKPALFVHASRGCPYNCAYCPYKVFGKYRTRNPKFVIEELKHLKEKYNIKGFFFRDPTFIIDEERIKHIANLMIKENLNLLWGCETRIDLLSVGLLDLLYQAGLRAIKIGVESLNQELLKKHGRFPSRIKMLEEIIEYCKKKRIKVIAFYIIGLPEDNESSIQNTIAYSRKLNTDFANYTIFTPIPGTRCYESFRDKIIEDNLNNFDNFHVVFKHDQLSKEIIISLHENAVTGYYFRSSYILAFLRGKLKEWIKY